MSSPGPNDDTILALASQVKNFAPDVAERRPSVFLSLAPTTSASYPKKKTTTAQQQQLQQQQTAVDVEERKEGKTSVVAGTSPVTEAKTSITGNNTNNSETTDVRVRRSSSLSSNASTGSSKSGPSRFRFLKLGPVHWGEHLDDHQQDWHEVVVE